MLKNKLTLNLSRKEINYFINRGKINLRKTKESEKYIYIPSFKKVLINLSLGLFKLITLPIKLILLIFVCMIYELTELMIELISELPCETKKEIKNIGEHLFRCLPRIVKVRS